MINVAVIGTGNISRFHIEGYLKFPERCKITHLVDMYPDKAEQKKTDYKLPDARVVTSYKDILNDPGINLVSIATPPYCHKEIAEAFLLAGKNVIVEKPMAASLEECDAMIAASKKERGYPLGYRAKPVPGRHREPQAGGRFGEDRQGYPCTDRFPLVAGTFLL
ncbi:hypothetical protein AGMMS50267_01740 [Spirochaetia bacterium]|nr:hypothetical protein AGMMS50267_01740 [Spirochaetia bacterium]